MLRSAPTRRILSALASRHRLSTTVAASGGAVPPPPPLHEPASPPLHQTPIPVEDGPDAHRKSAGPSEGDPSAHWRSTGPQRERERKQANYEEEQARALRAALAHVVSFLIDQN